MMMYTPPNNLLALPLFNQVLPPSVAAKAAGLEDGRSSQDSRRNTKQAPCQSHPMKRPVFIANIKDGNYTLAHSSHVNSETGNIARWKLQT